ncbi:hypothetical protein [uncultured Dokdonia sp.]|nr:hypothetical protein [uncultured Dokdonia sp.]
MEIFQIYGVGLVLCGLFFKIYFGGLRETVTIIGGDVGDWGIILN